MASIRGTVWFSGNVSANSTAESEVVPEKRLQGNLKVGTLQSMKIPKVREVNYRAIISKLCKKHQALVAQNLRHFCNTLQTCLKSNASDRREGGRDHPPRRMEGRRLGRSGCCNCRFPAERFRASPRVNHRCGTRGINQWRVHPKAGPDEGHSQVGIGQCPGSHRAGPGFSDL